MTGRKTTVRTHLVRRDATVPPAVDLLHPDAPGVPFCTCGLRADHPCHTLPAAPMDAQRLAAGEDGGEG